jgi:hypothetical protein
MLNDTNAKETKSRLDQLWKDYLKDAEDGEDEGLENTGVNERLIDFAAYLTACAESHA